MRRHHIEPSRETVRGYFSPDLAPVLEIDSGETVVMQTLDAGFHTSPHPQTGAWDWGKRLDWFDPESDQGHALCGPVAIRGAEPGMVLEIAIDEVVSGSWGWSVGGGYQSVTNDRLGVSSGDGFHMVWVLDRSSGFATTQTGQRIKMRPFAGVMGMPPALPGQHPTGPPRVCGGNLDCKELVAGTRLYLPVSVPDALFSAGDGHAAQGDGEVSGVAIECPLDRLALTLTLKPAMRLNAPRAWTPEAWIAFGFDQDLDQAAIKATDAMLALMEDELGLRRREALALASVAVDLRVTQIVNGVKGVHAMLPHGAVQPASHD